MSPTITARLYERLRRMGSPSTVPGSLPVLFFGDLLGARIATVGLNPSLQEYLDREGVELQGQRRRFQTLASLGAIDRASLTDAQCDCAIQTMRGYFDVGRPVYAWFAALGRVVNGFGFAFQERTAAHLDLVQESTSPVWREVVANGTAEANTLLCSDLCFLRWQIETFAPQAVLCTSRTVLDELLNLTGADIRDQGEFAGRRWTVAVAPIGVHRVAIAGWNIPLAQAPGLRREQQVELGQLLRQRVNRAGIPL